MEANFSFLCRNANKNSGMNAEIMRIHIMCCLHSLLFVWGIHARQQKQNLINKRNAIATKQKTRESKGKYIQTPAIRDIKNVTQDRIPSIVKH